MSMRRSSFLAGACAAVVLAMAAPAGAVVTASDVNFGFVDSVNSKLIGMTFSVAQQQIVPFTILSSAQGLSSPRSFALDLTDNAPTANSAHGVIADPGARKVFLANLNGTSSVIASSFELLSQPWSVAVDPNEVEDADYYVTDADPAGTLKVIKIVRPQNYIQVLAQSSSGIKQPTKVIVVSNACAGGSLLGGDLAILDTDAADPSVWRVRGTVVTKLIDSSVLDVPVDMDLACGHAGPSAIANGTLVVADNTVATGLVFRGLPALPGPGTVQLPPADGMASPPLAQASSFMIDNWSNLAGFVPQDFVFTEPALGMLVGYVVTGAIPTILASGSDGLVSPNDVLVSPYEAPGGTSDHLYVVTDSSAMVITVRPSTGEVKLVANVTTGIAVPRDPQTLSDADGDKVADILDNCPAVANPDQGNVDGDATGDACDPDIDNDGIANAADNCPTVANATQSNIDADLYGDACDCNADGDTHPWCKVDQSQCDTGSKTGCSTANNRDCADEPSQCTGHIQAPATCTVANLALIPKEDPAGSGTFKDACNLIGSGDGLDQDCDNSIDEDCSGGICATLASPGSTDGAGSTDRGAWEYGIVLGAVVAAVRGSRRHGRKTRR